MDHLPNLLARGGREYELPASYVQDFFQWRQVAEMDLGFEDIIARPEALLQDLTARLGLQQVRGVCWDKGGDRLIAGWDAVPCHT